MANKVSIPRIRRAWFKGHPDVAVFPGGVGNHVMARNEELVAFVEQLLQDAKSGAVTGIVNVLLQANGVVFTGWSGNVDQNVFTTSGAIGVLQREFQDEFVEGLTAGSSSK